MGEAVGGAGDEPLIGLDDVTATAERLAGRVLRTPLVALGSTGVLLKAENLQPSGSFKLRGALNSMLQLDEHARRRGVVAHSSGNHAVAVAMAGVMLGVPTTVVMPEDAPAVKQDWTERLGATVVVVGPASDERRDRATELADSYGLAPIEPYDSDAVLAATGTIALEILDDLPPAPFCALPVAPGATDRAQNGGGDGGTVIYVPVSGGGLAGGIATAAKLTDPSVRVVGVEPEVAADALASLRAGHPVALPAEQMARTMADGLRVQQVGARPWPHLAAHLDDVVTVTEDEIREAMVRVATEARLVAEPSGAVAAAAAVARHPEPDSGIRAVAVLSGGNVDPELLVEVLGGPR